MLDTTQNNQVAIKAYELNAAIKYLKLTVSTKGTTPILEHIYFDGSGHIHAMNLQSSGTDQFATWKVSGDYMPHNPFTVSLVSIEKIMTGAAHDSLIEFTTEGQKVSAKVDGLHSKLKACDPCDFPRLRDPGDLRIRFELPAETLSSVLKFTFPCISNEYARYYLRGVYIHSDAKGNLAFVSTDGHKLAFRALSETWPNSTPHDGVIFPLLAVKTLISSIGKNNAETLTLEIYKDQVIIKCDQWELQTRVIDGQFPDYIRVIPDNKTACFVADNAALLKSVKRLQGLAPKGCPLVIDGESDALSFSHEDEEHAMPLNALHKDGDCFPVGADIDYLKTLLETFDNQGAKMLGVALGSKGNAIKLVSPEVSGLYVLMPKRF